MNDNKNFLRFVFDAMIDARTKHAAREVAKYKSTMGYSIGDKPRD